MLFITMKALDLVFDELMHQMIENKITDLHIDPIHAQLIFRRHKLKIETRQVDECMALYSYLKFKANLYLESFGTLQTGRFDYVIHQETYFLRLAVLENQARKHAVLRILNIVVIDDLESCGLKNDALNKTREMMNVSHGLILFCGKTGAGKSTTLFAGLNEIKHKEIFTLENPIEKIYPHLIQMECPDDALNDHISQLLRHDPDVLVIGEIRSSVELQQAIRAALSGHLLMSTLHAGSIEEVVMRLQELNIARYDLLCVIKGIVFQRVVVNQGEVVFQFEVKTEQEIKDMMQ